MHSHVTYRQIPVYVAAFDRVPEPSCPLWQSSSLGAQIENGRPYTFYAMDGYYLYILP
jgi:hypothetical protein